MEDKGMPESLTPLRHVKAVDLDAKSDLLPTYESSWAVVVGVNNYKDASFNRLDNALKDALGMAEVLVTRLDFRPENVFLALDPKPEPGELPYVLASNVKSASKADIEDLLLNVLPEKVRENDRVLVFYAGHGDQRPVPGEKDKSRAFLIPADAEPGKWNTYVEWEMVRRAGDEFSKAKHIFYILDACYSGIVSTRDASEPPREVRDALTNRARQALAAGTSRQVVADAGREGHSPFTWHLIQGLRGDAVNPERSTQGSVISAHDLIGYVRRKVAEEDSTEQTPSGGSIAGHGGGDFIFTSPLIGFSGQEHLRLGVGLMELGLRSGERVCFESAARNLGEATHLKRMAREDAAEAEEWLGRALLHTGSDEVLLTLDSAAAQGRATALLYLGIAQARLGNVNAACQSLESFAASLPNHADAAWAAAYARQLRETGGKRKYALLVGVNRYPSSPLQGCVNDVFLVKALLEEVYGFDPAYIKMLTDEHATAASIVTELENLVGVALPQDTVVFLFSGHGTQVPDVAGLTRDGLLYALAPYDWEHLITEPELHALLRQIPARDKLFIGGAAHVCPDHDTSAEEDGYRFFAACQRNQYDYDTNADGKAYGAFIYQLCRVSRGSAKKSAASTGTIAREVKKSLKVSGMPQVPQYFGNPSAPLLPWQPRGVQPNFLALHEFGDRREYAAVDTPALEVWQARLEALGNIPHPRAWLSCARAWISQGQPIRSLHCAEQAVQQAGCDEREARLMLCEAHLQARKLDAAIEDAQALLGYLSPDESDAQIKRMTQLSSPRRRALIVAIQNYPEAIGINLKGPYADAEALKATLTDRCGFASGDIEALIDEQATSTAILSKFDDLVQHAKTEPALFYFAGLGTDSESGPALVAADASKSGDPSTILLEELSHRTQVRPTNLIAIFDAGWTKFDTATAAKMAAMRVFIPKDEREHISLPFPGMSTVDRDPTLVPQIGLATIYTGSIAKSYEREPELVEAIQESGQKRRPAGAGTRGMLTMALVDALLRGDTLTMTYADWVAAAANAKPHVRLQRGGARLFENAVMLERALWPVWRLRDGNLHETEELLHRLTELRKGRDPDSYLDLAIARMMYNSYDDARGAVEMCLTHRRQQLVEADTDRVALGEVSWPEAHYIRGRVLFALRHYSAAESALGIALQQYRDSPLPQNAHEKLVRDAQLARAHYWHGRAVQELIGQNLLTAAESDFREYLRLGAPFGDSERAAAFLAERTKAAETKKSEGGRKTKTAKRKRT